MLNPLAAAATLQIGDPVRHRGVAVSPLSSPASPRVRYLGLAHARWLGAAVREVHLATGGVRHAVLNATPGDVLVHEDEVLPGGHERALLVRAGGILMLGPTRVAPMPVPGWDRHPQPPVDDELEALLRRFPLTPGQCGALFSVAGRPVRLDLHSCPEAFGLRYPVLLRRLVMEAHREPIWVATPEDLIARFADAALRARTTTAPTPGRGARLVVRDEGLAGHGLVVDGELVHLTVTAC
jgi:hypothetical protein